MIRAPLYPLARILPARARGEAPEPIVAEAVRKRREAEHASTHYRAEGRLLVILLLFLVGFLAVGGRMAMLASSEPTEPTIREAGTPIAAQRADIVDRQGRILATNLATHALYAQPPEMLDKARAARELAAIFPDLDEGWLLRQFTGGRKFIWLRRHISPEQQQLVHDIGDPGLRFGPREMRLYPNGPIAAHVLGGASFGREGVAAAEVVGVAGVEKQFDAWLRDPANAGQSLRLSLDLGVQAAVEEVLAGGMRMFRARGASAVLMEVQSGQVVALASLPDFDPNDRPRPLTTGQAADSPLFNRAAQGLYELGSIFKTFTIAQALQEGIAAPDTMIDIRGPLRWGRHRISDFHYYGKQLSVTDILVKSSNVGTARLAQQIGVERHRAFLEDLGLLAPTPVELIEAAGARPLVPANWSELSTMTISYGHGLSSSPLHLAAAYATIVNDGYRVAPTLLAEGGGGAPGAPGAPVNAAPVAAEPVISAQVSRQLRQMLRAVVTRGTASFGEVEGYRVGGKTGTADKPALTGGYLEDKVIATFASVFPADDPRYVLIVALDEAEETMGKEPRRTAGWTAVPVAAEIIRRAAPLLGLRPDFSPEPVPGEPVPGEPVPGEPGVQARFAPVAAR